MSGSYQNLRIHFRLLSELKDACRALIRTVGFVPAPFHLALIRTEGSMSGSNQNLKDPFRALIRTEGFVLDPFQLALIRTEGSMSGSYQNWRIHVGLLSELEDSYWPFQLRTTLLHWFSWDSFSLYLAKDDPVWTSCGASYFMISRLFQSFLFSEIKTKEGSMTILLKLKDVIKSAI